MKEKLRFTLEVELDIDGKIPADSILVSRTIDAMNASFPSLIFDDDDLDCAVFVNSWEYAYSSGTVATATHGK